MAYLQVQTLVDTDRRHVTKRVNSANTESASLVVNAAGMAYAISLLSTDASANNFKVGETVNAASGGSATVLNVLGSTLVQLVDVTGTFADDDTVTGAESGKIRVQSGSLAPADKELHVGHIVYNIAGNSGTAKVELLWEGTGGGANNRTLALLSGSGELALSNHGMRANNTANSATGNLILNTVNWDANSHYTLIVDVSKVSGYAKPDPVSNQNLGY